MRDALALVGLDEQARRAVSTLSGGQRQRVALARAVVFEPRMMLLDEPLAALDKQLRDTMQLELRRLQQRVGITTVAVTHDQVEALTMADEVAVMCDGRIEQVGSPEDVYARPAQRVRRAVPGRGEPRARRARRARRLRAASAAPRRARR